MSDWASVVIAGLALLLSVVSLAIQGYRQWIRGRRADVVVYFHWLPARAKVQVPGVGEVLAGYHLVLENRGPATARAVGVELRDGAGQVLSLVDLEQDELPLSLLDSGARYPIPFTYQPFTPQSRRFEATISWTDGRGSHDRVVPLRRGHLPS